VAEERKIVTKDDPEVQEALAAFNKIYEPQADSFMDSTQKSGVLMSILSAVMMDEKFQYRQTLRTASFQDNKQSRLAGGSVSECERYGAPLSPIINQIESQNGERGEHGVRQQTLAAMTHFNFNTNGYQNKNKPRDKSKPL